MKNLSFDQLEMYRAKLSEALESMYVASAILADAGIEGSKVQEDLERTRRTLWDLQDAARLALEGKEAQSDR